MSATVTNAANRKGQPIVVLAVLLALWVGGRTMLWQSPFPEIMDALELPSVFADVSQVETAIPELAVSDMSERSENTLRTKAAIRSPRSMSRTAWLAVQSQLPVRASGQPIMLASHQALWMSALSSVPVPPEVAQLFSGAALAQDAVAPAKITDAASSPDRWSIDSWAFYRPSAINRAGSGPLPATYGASQAGAVLRYRLDPSSQRNSSIYIRGTKALSGARQKDIAAGFSATLISPLPVAAHAEIRASPTSSGTEIRPAAFVVTEFAPQELPLGAEVSTYAQAGYVGGEFATPFVDGQARVDREVAAFDLATLRAGAGIWGGAQKGAARLDVGPTASVDMTLGGAQARLSMDYRHRVAGDAEPQSGIAITLSTGF